MASPSNPNSSFDNAVLSNWVYTTNQSAAVSDPSNVAPPGYALLKLYGDPNATNAEVALVGKVDPSTNTITSLAAVVRGTRFSELNSSSLRDLYPIYRSLSGTGTINL